MFCKHTFTAAIGYWNVPAITGNGGLLVFTVMMTLVK
jgi:hypothetical protein